MLLALDIGGSTGWAVFDGRKLVHYGAFKTTAHPGRWLRWQNSVDALITQHRIDSVAYEVVRSHLVVGPGGKRQYATTAAHNYGAYWSHLEDLAHMRKFPLIPVEVSTWKKVLGVKNKSRKFYVDKVNTLYGTSFEDKKQGGDDIAAAIGIGRCALGVTC